MNKRKSIFEKNSTDEGYFRWLIDPTWHHCCSMYQEAALVSKAYNSHERYHHLRSCLYFGIGMVESFLNNTKLLQLKNVSHDEQHKKLKANFYDKTLWPFVAPLNSELQAIREDLLDLNDVRAEITHPRRKDHAVYRELDSICPNVIVRITTEYIAGVHEVLDIPFPYWLLGWNFTGMNNDESHPIPINNSQFMHALRHMGFSIFSSDYGLAKAWEKQNMTSLEGFRNLKIVLDNCGIDREPAVMAFMGLNPPRLTRRWWDRDFLLQ